ncbi:hypothetical protein [Streptomyces lydicus]|uniref:hypothetical protein n=1 Tax=Streptomyces lydicus TaxID=47763 RepID=UPI0037D184E6
MNRLMSLLLAAGYAMGQTVFLFACHQVRVRAAGGGPGLVLRDVRLFGLDLDGFSVRDTGQAQGWVPQLVFLVLCSGLMYAVLRSAPPDARPQLRTVLALLGAALLAAGVAELAGPALDPRSPLVLPTSGQWVGRAQVDGATALPEQYALWSCWLLMPSWAAAWLLRRWAPVRMLLGTADDAAGGEESPAAVCTVRRRRDVVCAGLIPMVLLAVAGGAVLRHTNVRHLDQSASVTFDPELWLPYHPPALVERWSGVLYPALRMRPLDTEETAGWLATLVVCLVFLAVLAAALYAVVRWAAGRHPVRLFMNCWYATVLAAVAAALVESGLLQGPWAAPREGAGPMGLVHPFEAALGDAVRFGAVWGWATGACCLGAVWMMTRREARTRPKVHEEQLSHAE